MLKLMSCHLLLPAEPCILVLSNIFNGTYSFTVFPALPLQYLFSSLPWSMGNSSPLLPTQGLHSLLMCGVTMSFRIRVSQGTCFKQAPRNLKSAHNYSDTISKFIRREVDLGRLVPLPPSPSLVPPLLQISPKEAEAKQIIDLSSTKGHGANDAIQKGLCAVSYTWIGFSKTLAHSAILKFPDSGRIIPR